MYSERKPGARRQRVVEVYRFWRSAAILSRPRSGRRFLGEAGGGGLQVLAVRCHFVPTRVGSAVFGRSGWWRSTGSGGQLPFCPEAGQKTSVVRLTVEPAEYLTGIDEINERAGVNLFDDRQQFVQVIAGND